MNWDNYFLGLCNAAAAKSPCLSRQIGALIVRENSIVSTGYNGPPRGIPHCDKRIENDSILQDLLLKKIESEKVTNTLYQSPIVRLNNLNRSICPRKLLDYESGTHMELCPAQHAEENAVSNAARNGVSVLGCTLYLNTVIPCQKCFGTLINAGIREIVCVENSVYDKQTQFLIKHSTILIRKFNLE